MTIDAGSASDKPRRKRLKPGLFFVLSVIAEIRAAAGHQIVAAAIAGSRAADKSGNHPWLT
jgi:hypothetical protein